MNSILADYAGLIASDVEEATEKVAKKTVEAVRQNIKQAGIKGTGAYSKSITSKRLSLQGNRFQRTVYARDPHYRLTHLLEFGHAKVNGGRTRAFPHWNKAEREAVDAFEKALKEAIEK